MLLIGLGTGIGGGMILDGKLYRGSIGAAAELGHMVIDMNGPRAREIARTTDVSRRWRPVPRSHGRRAGSPASNRIRGLGRRSQPAARSKARWSLSSPMTETRSPREVLELIGERLGVALASYANIFNPEAIVIGGGVMAAGEMLLEPARA